MRESPGRWQRVEGNEIARISRDREREREGKGQREGDTRFHGMQMRGERRRGPELESGRNEKGGMRPTLSGVLSKSPGGTRVGTTPPDDDGGQEGGMRDVR